MHESLVRARDWRTACSGRLHEPGISFVRDVFLSYRLTARPSNRIEDAA